MTRTYRAYAATLLGDYLDIRGQQNRRPDIYASDRYGASQKFGEEVRASGDAGLLYDSLRRGRVSTWSRSARAILRTSYRQIISKLRSWQGRARSTSTDCRFENTAERRHRFAFAFCTSITVIEHALEKRARAATRSRRVSLEPAKVRFAPIVFSNSGSRCQAPHDHPCRAQCSLRGRGEPSA
jgi:hypothetical protein